jgi:hypothetical protein
MLADATVIRASQVPSGAAPRVLVVDTERKVTVLEKNKLTASGVFDAMKKVVRDTWKEDVEAALVAVVHGASLGGGGRFERP